MSATKLEPVGVPPAHVFDLQGQLVNAEVGAQDLDELRWYAECEGYDLEGECQSRYSYGSGWLTLEQYSEILRAIAQRRADLINATPHHYHRCDNCGASQMHFDRHCNHAAGDVTEECLGCEEGTRWLIKRRPEF